MDLQTLQHLRTKHGDKSNFVLYTADNVLYFYTSKDFLVWDDEHEVLHCIRANTAGSPEYVNGQSPIIIKSMAYSEIFFISSGYDCETFKNEIMDSFFGDLLSDKQKAVLTAFIDSASTLKDIEYNNEKYNLDVKKAESTISSDIFNAAVTKPELETE